MPAPGRGKRIARARGISRVRAPPCPGPAQAGTAQGDAVLAEAVSAFRAALGSRLVAGYALGSLAHGGFSPLVSDVDLGLVLQDPLRVSTASPSTGSPARCARAAPCFTAGYPCSGERR